MQINGLAAVVTGGASGLGAATATHLASLGARVAVVDINQSAAESMATKIGGIGLEDCSALTQEAPPVVATEAVIADILAMLRPDPAGIDALRNGRRLMMQVPDDTYLVVDEAGTWVSVVTVEAGACHIEVNAPS